MTHSSTPKVRLDGTLRATTPEYPYDLEKEINWFFTTRAKTSTTREECDNKASELVGGKAVPVAIQGMSSYSVYAGWNLQYVVHFRPKPFALCLETFALVKKIHGSLVPTISFHGQLGDDCNRPLVVYVIERFQGLTYLDFAIANRIDKNIRLYSESRNHLMVDVAQFFASTWNAHIETSSEYLKQRYEEYTKDLQMLLHSLPPRFHSVVRKGLQSIDDILTLPICLLHLDFLPQNIIINPESGRVVGIIDWGEAKHVPFGLNLQYVQSLVYTHHYTNGWSRNEDSGDLMELFWKVFGEKIGGLDKRTLDKIKQAGVVGLLLHRGFTRFVANVRTPRCFADDEEESQYDMDWLNGFLINSETRMVGVV